MSLAGNALVGANLDALYISSAHSSINPTAHSQPSFHCWPEGFAFLFFSLLHYDGHWPRSLTVERAGEGKASASSWDRAPCHLVIRVTWSLHKAECGLFSLLTRLLFSDLGLPTLSWTQWSMLEYGDLLGPALTILLCSAGNGDIKGQILPSLLTASEHWTTGVLVLHEVLERGATWALLPERTFWGWAQWVSHFEGSVYRKLSSQLTFRANNC